MIEYVMHTEELLLQRYGKGWSLQDATLVNESAENCNIVLNYYSSRSNRTVVVPESEGISLYR